MPEATDTRLAEILTEAERLLNELRERTAAAMQEPPTRRLMASIECRVKELDGLVYDYEAEKERLKRERRKAEKSACSPHPASAPTAMRGAPTTPSA